MPALWGCTLRRSRIKMSRSVSFQEEISRSIRTVPIDPEIAGRIGLPAWLFPGSKEVPGLRRRFHEDLYGSMEHRSRSIIGPTDCTETRSCQEERES